MAGQVKGKGMDLLIGLGPPPKLGQRDKMPRAMSSSKSYRGSPSAEGPGEAEGDDDGDENMFDQQDQDHPDELLVGAAHDVISALHARDAEAVAVALKSFVEMAG